MTDLTRNQSLVFEALNRADAPLSAYAILTELQQHGVRAPVQVYRALEKLVDLGLVHKLETLNAFVACSHDHAAADASAATVFTICNDCGDVVEFTDDRIDTRLRRRAADERFLVDTTIVELRGLCGQCSAHESGD